MLELIIVIAIISIMVGMTATNLGPWQANMALKSAARDLYSIIQDARLLAVRNNSDAAVVFNAATNQYHLCSAPGADGRWDGANDMNGTGDNTIVRTITLNTPDNKARFGKGKANAPVNGGTMPGDYVEFSGPDNVLVVNSRGLSLSGEGYVYLENRYQDTAYAVGAEASGFVRMWKWQNGAWL
ncbi:MAG: prepilin-type cleavage/methylation domain-containing protein [Desulfobacter sp.]|nr:MAG: prepilin-type cleavage/methylation domain-containing protein [Desulfobacter sp.]